MDRLVILMTKATMDKMNAMVLLTTGAVTMDMPVDIFLTHDVVYYLLKENINKPLPIETAFPEVEQLYMKAMESGKMKNPLELFEEIKEMGEVRVVACGLVADIFGATEEKLPDWVDEIAGVADFIGRREQGDIVITL